MIKDQAITETERKLIELIRGQGDPAAAICVATSVISAYLEGLKSAQNEKIVFVSCKKKVEEMAYHSLEALYSQCGGIRDLFFSRPDYRRERIHSVKLQCMDHLLLVEELLRIADVMPEVTV